MVVHSRSLVGLNVESFVELWLPLYPQLFVPRRAQLLTLGVGHWMKPKTEQEFSVLLIRGQETEQEFSISINEQTRNATSYESQTPMKNILPTLASRRAELVAKMATTV